MKHTRWIPIGAALIVAASASAQVPTPAPAPAEINVFGDETAPQATSIRYTVRGGVPVRDSSDYPQTIFFTNGRQFRGELAGVTKDEVLWQRKDASEPLRFSRAEVRRVSLVPSERTASVFNKYLGTPAPAPGTPALATVKLPGGDWLRGALTSADGETFTLALEGGAPVQLSRAHIEWLSFGPKPAPAFGLGLGKMALDGWLTGNPPQVESKDGTLTVQDAQWIGRNLAAPNRFEIAFELPGDGEEGLRLWMQPFNPQPNSYSPGTVQFTFGRKAIKWLVFYNNIQPTEVPLPAEAQAEIGPVRYRVLYDYLAQRVVVLRNGRQIGDWSLKPKPEVPANQRPSRPPLGICLDREDRGQKSVLQLRQFRVLPWDGAVPAADEPPARDDRLSTATAATISGRLGQVREKELVFGGQTLPFTAEPFVKFPQAPAPLAEGDALLSFGEQGEVSLAEMQMSEGKVRGRTGFAALLELPASALQFIAFASSPADGPRPPVVGDLLIFKNGDELPGALVAAATGGPLRWRLATGQEIEFKTERIAGVRLTSAPRKQPSGVVELRTGERLRGEVAGFDDRQLHWRHEVLGELAVDRGQLWRLYPNADQSLKDGGQDPESWLRDTPNSKRLIQYSRLRKRAESWLALDGRFLLRTSDNNGQQSLGPFLEVGSAQDRYELRVDFASVGANQGTLNINFFTAGEGGVGMNLSSYSMNLRVQNPRAPNGGVNKEVQLRDKIGENVRRLSLRAFVNRPDGTIDVFLNGYNVGRAGQAAADRMPGVGKSVSIDTYTSFRTQILLSQVSIAPWSGELPRAGVPAAVTILTNGDIAAGAPISLAEGRWHVESEIGPLDLPVEKVQAVEFGGEMQPVSVAGRLRLVDGSPLLVDRFQWTGSEISAHHALFGDLKIPASAVSELIYDPAPVRPAIVEDPSKRPDKAPVPNKLP